MNMNKRKYTALAVALALHSYVSADDDIIDAPAEYVERIKILGHDDKLRTCLLYTSPSPRD